MKNYIKIMVVFVLIIMIGFFISTLFASAPTLSVVANTTNQLIVTVKSDANSSVVLYYDTNGVSKLAGYIGTTDNAGAFTRAIFNNVYLIPQNALVYVIVNGQQSTKVAWPRTFSTPVVNNATPVTSSTEIKVEQPALMISTTSLATPEGVYLHEVPYTGLTSHAKTYLFMFGISVWTAALSYYLVKRKTV